MLDKVGRVDLNAVVGFRAEFLHGSVRRVGEFRRLDEAEAERGARARIPESDLALDRE
jgi:hypothetical protein